MNRWAVALTAIGVFILLCVIGVGIYIYSGAYNTAATEEVNAFTAYVLSAVKANSIRAHAEPVEHLASDDSVMVRRGYKAFSDMCVMCHGAPGVERGWVGQGMKPQPPALSHAAEEFSKGELFWIVKHGIKHAGMPALAPTHSDEEIHELVAFIRQLPEMTPEEYEALGAEAARDTVQATGGDGHEGHSH